ncbi:hypothetical protein AN639_03190 [Candidatus Epulonipiscium fishelsonii]|uniref:Uncharacterized protein n=1 Tax=Candidatus Epulonipiscium fishelsonii TaxID=77094 RepID=A0ACC8XGA4_9FIRM|nr:hypothetical protein AN639_03190 [Epulopiscium sp. SCG-B05WGA-EpuloA1]ONI42621.1 hypothetical protein AN396_13645 [Epulopiscium sp. SCG-B11WGA-EpuloA1]ONI47243.1 hypothetical protein AN644_01105 [Epulopiscium sp. SCG-C06WGA-EpuloA1]
MSKKLVMTAGALITTYALLEPHWQKYKEYTVNNIQIPSEFDGFKIAFLADIHYGGAIGEKNLSKIVDSVNNWEPDLILLGGDYISRRKHIYPCFNQLSKLRAVKGVYGVLGNHDVTEGLTDTINAMEKANIRSINNDGLWITKNKQKIKLGGVGDFWTQHQDLDKTLFDTKPEDYIILVTHNPQFVYKLNDKDDINLILSGHTHGGQFPLLKYLGKYVPADIDEKFALSYLSGKRKRHNRDIIVSNGVGTAKFPFRIMTRPEIIYITLHKHNSNN